MSTHSSLKLIFILAWLLTGCASKIAYQTTSNVSAREAAKLVTDLSLSQRYSSVRPSSVEVFEYGILWEKDLIIFDNVKSTELLKKFGYYLVQINFKGDTFRKNDWLVAFKSAQINEAQRYLDALTSLVQSRSNQSKINISGKPTLPVELSSAILAPTPITGNSGKFMCPFTASGTIAYWAQDAVLEKDNGSELAAKTAGAVGRNTAKNSLKFVPYGLGELIGEKTGETAARAVTRKNITPQLPAMDVVISTSDISFNTAEDLAVYMYAKNSSHAQYPQVLELTTRVYPELLKIYAGAVEKATQLATAKVTNIAVIDCDKKEKSPQEKLSELLKLKDAGLISESEYSVKRSDILKSL